MEVSAHAIVSVSRKSRRTKKVRTGFLTVSDALALVGICTGSPAHHQLPISFIKIIVRKPHPTHTHPPGLSCFRPGPSFCIRCIDPFPCTPCNNRAIILVASSLLGVRRRSSQPTPRRLRRPVGHPSSLGVRRRSAPTTPRWLRRQVVMLL